MAGRGWDGLEILNLLPDLVFLDLLVVFALEEGVNFATRAHNGLHDGLFGVSRSSEENFGFRLFVRLVLRVICLVRLGLRVFP